MACMADPFIGLAYAYEFSAVSVTVARAIVVAGCHYRCFVARLPATDPSPSDQPIDDRAPQQQTTPNDPTFIPTEHQSDCVCEVKAVVVVVDSLQQITITPPQL